MERSAGRQPRRIDLLPKDKRRRVIDAMLARRPTREIAKMAGVSHVAVADYIREVLKPSLAQAEKIRAANEMQAESLQAVQEMATLTREVVNAGPVIAIRDDRLAALDDRRRRLHQVMEERAADPSMADVPGGKTGLLVRTYKSLV